MKRNWKQNTLNILCGLAFTFGATTYASSVSAKKMVTQTPAPLPSVSVPDFADLAEALLPTVVNISTVHEVSASEQTMPGFPQMPQGSPFEDFFKEFMERAPQGGQAPKQNRKQSALGSGFVIDAEKGYILTNNHVIADADEVKIILSDDTKLDAKIIGTDAKTDLAVLQVETDHKLIAAKWGDSDQIRVGSWVMAIGNPFGLGGTVTAGIVSARQRDINAGPYDDFIQTDASINRGNSGGPMFNTAGQVIGVNTAIYSPSGGSVGIGFAVPSNMAKPVIAQLIKYGQTKRGWLGVRIQQVTDEIAESLSLPKTYGALVAAVNPDGPSKDSGIKAGDVIIDFDGKEISQMRQLPRIVAETEVGKKVPVTVWRKGKKKKLFVTLGQLEKAEETGLLADNKTDKTPAEEKSKGEKVDHLGLTLVKITDALREEYNLAEDIKGLLITEVDEDSNAAEKGVRPGDVLVEFDQEAVASAKDVAKLAKQAVKEERASVLLMLKRNNNTRFTAIQLSSGKDK